MIVARKSTPAFPLTVIDHIADLEHCHSVDEIRQFSEQLPSDVVHDDRFNRAVARRLGAIHAKKAAA